MSLRGRDPEDEVHGAATSADWGRPFVPAELTEQQRLLAKLSPHSGPVPLVPASNMRVQQPSVLSNATQRRGKLSESHLERQPECAELPQSESHYDIAMKHPDAWKRDHGYLRTLVNQDFLRPPKPYKWGTQRSTAIGLSCLFFAVPAYYILTHTQNFYEGCMWVLVLLGSFGADYAVVGRRDTWYAVAIQLFDRWIATVGLFVQLTRCLGFSWQWGTRPFLVDCLGLLSSTFCLYESRVATTYEAHVFWHSAWHVVAGCFRTWYAVVEQW